MSNLDTNRWNGKSEEDILAESFHELRDPIYLIGGYLNVLNSMELSTEQKKHYIELALNYALHAKEIVDSVYQYMNEKTKDQ